MIPAARYVGGMRMKFVSIFSAVSLVSSAVLHAETSPEELVKRQCRSIHLGFKMGESVALYNEIVPQKSAPGTYFCALGFNRGYFGMQELANGKKVVIFSTWDDAKGDDKNAVTEENRAKLIEQGEGVRVGRFGGEGTGAQSFYDYDWKIGEPTRFLVQAAQVDDHTEFAGWFFDATAKKWQLMTRFQTPTKGLLLKGGYSFIEDFRRNYESAQISRRAVFQNAWSLGKNDKWTRLTTAKFTGDTTPSKNVDAGPEGAGFFLQTGGETENKTTPLWKEMTNTASTMKLPEGVVDLLKSKAPVIP